MPKTGQEVFKDSLDKAFSGPGVKLNQGTMTDYAQYRQGVKEDESGDSTPMIRRSIKKLLQDKKKQEDKKYSDIQGRVSQSKRQMKSETKEETDLNEKWSEKYKKSIDCSHPKGFSQKAHCNGLKKEETKEQEDRVSKSAKKQFAKDIQTDPDYIEFKKNSKYRDNDSEYSYGVPNVSNDDPFISKKKYGRVGKSETREATGSGSSGAYSGPVFGGDDEFWERSRKETPKLKESDVEKVEATEATGSGSSGGYESPSMWAKSTKKKDWGPSRKTQIPGGGFVKIKKKCTKFPYCNQGDISNVKISKNESVKEAIKNVASKTGVSENTIKTILEYEYEKINKRHN